MKRAALLALALSLFALSADALAQSDLQQLASQGKIQADAPIQTTLRITIDAPPEKVWQRLTDVQHWPGWQAEIHDARIDGSLQAGTTLAWTSGVRINARLALVREPHILAWTGKAMNLRAIHVWTLEPLPGGRTQVTVNESMSGFLAGMVFSSKKLEESDQQWLNALKVVVEQK